MAEKYELGDSQAVGKVREMGGSYVIIGEILYLFLLQKLPILLSPFPSPHCMVESPVN